MATAKIHLVLNGNALCDFQSRNGGRIAAHTVAEFLSAKAEDASQCCRECSKKLEKIRMAARARYAGRN